MNAQTIWCLSDGTEQRLLDFVALLIVDVAHTCPRITEAQIALWLARVALGAKR